MTRATLVIFCLLTAACTTIRIDHGGANTIEHTGGAAEGKTLADEACRRARSGLSEVVSTVNKDDSRPPGTGKQITTFRCTNA